MSRLESDDDILPVCKSLSLTVLLGFVDFRKCALCNAMSLQERGH